KVLVTGGYSNSGFQSSAELYDPSTGTFSTTGSMSVGRYIHTATLLGNGKVLITGGYSNSGSQSNAELYDPSTGTFSTTGSMNSARYAHTATLLANGNVLVTGGPCDDGKTAEIYAASENRPPVASCKDVTV